MKELNAYQIYSTTQRIDKDAPPLYYCKYEVDQRIAELEAERASDQQELIDSIELNVSLCKENTKLRETWVSDELLEKLVVFMMDIGDFWGNKDETYAEARAILDKRRTKDAPLQDL